MTTEQYSNARSTAIHEAGHAVVAYLLRRPFKSISVIEDDDSYGRVEHAPPTGEWFRPDIEINTRTRTRIEEQVMIGLAGAETEAKWAKRAQGAPADLKTRLEVGARHDTHGIMHLALYVCASTEETEAYIEWLRQRVLNMVGHDPDTDDDRYWWLVSTLADAVQTAGSLPWRKAQTILRAADHSWTRSLMRHSPVFHCLEREQ